MTPGTASSSPITGDISITTNDVLCADLPAAISVSGVATQAGPAVQPAALDFGLVNCGATGTAQQVFVTNTGNQDFTVTSAVVDNTSFYSVSMSPPDGIVTAGSGQVVVTVTPNAIPAVQFQVPNHALLDGTLSISTNANVNSPNFSVPLTMGAKGVIVSNDLSTTNWTFPTVKFPGSSNFVVPIRNAGNAPLQVFIGAFSTTYFTMPVTVESVTPGSTILTTTFTPPSAGTAVTDQGMFGITPVGSNVFCAPLAASWQRTITVNGVSE